MNMLTAYGVQLQMHISIHQIGETSVVLNRSRPVVLWDLENRMLTFISDLNFPLLPEIRLCFDITCQGESICRTYGKLLWKEDSLTEAIQYGVILEPDGHGEVYITKKITRTVLGGRVKFQKYDFHMDIMNDKGNGQMFDVFT
ncbi:hypothetical protein GRF59_13005 [Paenibacillus sp. HJL G12]|uniref:Uncharacterized protein n=1 Tax=Paenibacillus dendrobii TaxID=2691084 RepID=A0A7X3IIH6_9BACL|nr:hypothetical protein [Paenibacillus dendrobii]MWV44547.1 hypothetical protein [Paenibacillus dendrobii]